MIHTDYNPVAVDLFYCLVRRVNYCLLHAPAHDWLFMLRFLVRRVQQAVSIAPLHDWAGLTGFFVRRVNNALAVASLDSWWDHTKKSIAYMFHAHTLMTVASVASDKKKAIFWLLPRTGSRSISCVISNMGFVDTATNIPIEVVHTHGIGVPEGCEDYHISCTVRNPYSWVLSWWHLWGAGHTFEEFVERGDITAPRRLLESIEKIKEPDVWVRFEHMEEDLMKIDYIKNGDDFCKQMVNQFIRENVYADEDHQGVLRRDSKDPRYTDYLSYYTQSGLDKVYTNYEKYFKKFGYQREHKPH